VPPPPDRTLWPWLLGLVLLVLGALIGYLLFHDGGNDKPHTATRNVAARTVPAVVGKSQVEAARAVTDAGLAPRIVPRQSDKPAGTVFAQKPGGGAQVDAGSAVQLFVSRGKGTIAVPDVVGLTAAEAVSKLDAAGLEAARRSVASSKPAGTVVAQKPAAGAQVQRASAVTVNVAAAPQQVGVPDVVGQALADALAELKTAGLGSRAVRVPSQQPSGTVVSQNPAAGSQAKRGTVVRLNVSRGPGGGGTTSSTTTTSSSTVTPATVTVPSVVGLQQTVALRKLQRAGLKARTSYVASSRPPGTVVRQSPAPGTTVRRGSRVGLSVSVGGSPQAQKTVPDVIGEDEGAATNRLQQAGFDVVVLDEATSDQSQDGIVVDEQPAGGSSAPAGSQVTIYVGRFTG
jgi:beta-lactam-binding protein with PASTA domain